MSETGLEALLPAPATLCVRVYVCVTVSLLPYKVGDGSLYTNPFWTRRHSKSSNPCSIAVPSLTLTLTLTFQPQNHVTSGISQGHSYTKFKDFEIIRLENALIDPVTLTFDLSTRKLYPFYRYPEIIPYIKFEHGIIRFWELCCV